MATLLHDSTTLKTKTKKIYAEFCIQHLQFYYTEINQSTLSLHIIFREEIVVSSAFRVLKNAIQVLEWALKLSAM